MQDFILNSGIFSGKPIVFLHGFPFDKRMWKYQLDSLHFPCYALDLPGSGFHKEQARFSLEDMADFVLEKIEYLGLNHPVIAGLSMGGYIALRLLEKAQSRFSGAILMDTKTISDSNETKLKRAQFMQNMRKEGLEKFIQTFIPNTITLETEKNPILSHFIYHEICFSQSTNGLSSQLLAMQGRTDTTHVLKDIHIPTLVLCGMKDTISTPEEMKEMSTKIKGSRFQLIQDSGHMSPLENPVQVNQAIQEFMHSL